MANFQLLINFAIVCKFVNYCFSLLTTSYRKSLERSETPETNFFELCGRKFSPKLKKFGFFAKSRPLKMHFNRQTEKSFPPFENSSFKIILFFKLLTFFLSSKNRQPRRNQFSHRIRFADWKLLDELHREQQLAKNNWKKLRPKLKADTKIIILADTRNEKNRYKNYRSFC